MRKEDLFRAIGDVRDEMILEAEPVKRKNTVKWKILSMAAVAVLVAGGALFAAKTSLLAPKGRPEAAQDEMAAVTSTGPREETMGENARSGEAPPQAEEAAPEEPVKEETVPAIPEPEQAAYDMPDQEEVWEEDADAAGIYEAGDTEISTRAVTEEAVMPEEAGNEAETAKGNAFEPAEEDAAEEAEAEAEETALSGSVNLAERELLKESSVQELSVALASGIMPDPKTVSVPSVVQSLDYAKLLPKDANPELSAELVLMKQGNALLFVHTETEKDVLITLYAQIPEDLFSGIRVYGDPDYVTQLGNVEILSEEVLHGENRTVLLELELKKNTKPDRISVQLQLCTDDGETYRVETCTLKASAESDMSGAARLAYAAGQTGVLLKSSERSQKPAYRRILVDIADLSDDDGADALRKLINYLIKD